MENLIIENDNLIALTDLLTDFSGKIDVMPIDPPYNTDIDYVGYKDGGFNEGWAAFMRKRLKAAYELLSGKGVMFINIDENELEDLLSVCRNIFGRENVMTLIWKKTNALFDKNRKEKPLESGIRRAHEYIVLCFKDRLNTVLNNIKQQVWNGSEFVDVEQPLETIIDGLGTNASAKDELEEIFGDRTYFQTPKPMKLIKELIRSASNKNSIILDFFAGSGTTGHAVMDLNKEDGGSRKFILITNNENDICRRVTIPRIKNCIDKYFYKENFDIFLNE